jgi:hypothetical protein
MEEFIIDKKKVDYDKKKSGTSKLREICSKIILSPCYISIIESCNDDGDIVFEIPMDSLGISRENIMLYKNEISSEFVANFIGEFLVRENIAKFAKIIFNLKEDYIDRVNKFVHGRFGMKIYNDRFVFRFHASLIQRILLEDFRKKII